MASPPPIIKWWRVSSRVQSHGDMSCVCLQKIKITIRWTGQPSRADLVFPLTTTPIKENSSENFWYTYNVGHHCPSFLHQMTQTFLSMVQSNCLWYLENPCHPMVTFEWTNNFKTNSLYVEDLSIKRYWKMSQFSIWNQILILSFLGWKESILLITQKITILVQQGYLIKEIGNLVFLVQQETGIWSL